MPKNSPKILVFDIETAPIISHVWTLWNNNVGLNQIVSDWHLLSWAAKWYGDSPRKVMYEDQRNQKNISDDKALCGSLWQLLHEADVVITHNGKKFDSKKVNARFAIHGFKPPSGYKHVDTREIAKKHFGFTSNKQEYLTDKLCKKYKKLKHKKFPGHELWSECLKGNLEAWKEMEKYNKHDVLSLEELYSVLQPWDNSVLFFNFTEDEEMVCNCGNKKFVSNGTKTITGQGRYQRKRCTQCGTELRGRVNEIKGEKKKNQLVKVT